MSFFKRKAAIIGAVLSAVMSAAILGSSLSYAASAGYKNWKQYGCTWSSKILGASGETVSKSGCAVTSAAILMVQSGSVADNHFTPGVIVDYLNQHSGFSKNGALNWGALTGYAPDFKFVQGAELFGTQEQKAAKIKSFLDAGYYIIAGVKYEGHFVAVDSVEGNQVIMMDPGSEKTSLFDTYAASGVVSLRLFKGANSDVTVTPAIKPTVMPDAPETAPVEIINAELIQPETAPEIIETMPPETIAVQTAPPVVTSLETTMTETTVITTTETVILSETTTASSESIPVQTAPPLMTTSESTSTTTKPAETEELIVITTKPMTSTEVVVTTTITPEMIDPAAESIPEIMIDPIEEEETEAVIDIILLEAPSTAPGEEAAASEPAETIAVYIPEEQAEATLFKIKEQNLFMQVRFHIHENLNLRETANTDSEILAVIPADTCLDVVEVDEEFKWGKVAFEGKEGWISLHFAGL